MESSRNHDSSFEKKKFWVLWSILVNPLVCPYPFLFILFPLNSVVSFSVLISLHLMMSRKSVWKFMHKNTCNYTVLSIKKSTFFDLTFLCNDDFQSTISVSRIRSPFWTQHRLKCRIWSFLTSLVNISYTMIVLI